MLENHVSKKQVLLAINEFEDISKYIDEEMFEVIFPSNVSSHLWYKFTQKYERDLLKLWIYLDNHNRESLAAFISDMIGESEKV